MHVSHRVAAVRAPIRDCGVKRNALVYMVFNDRLIEGSLKRGSVI
jgi:catabolite regulation protein CreA